MLIELVRRHFAEAWEAAVSAGRARVELFLIESADRTFDPECLPVDGDMPRMTIAEAISLLRLAGRGSGRPAGGGQSATHGRSLVGDPDWGTPEEEEQNLAEVRDRILGRLDRLRDRDDEEKLASGWTRHGDTLVPPGFGPVVEAKALALSEGEGEEEARGPSVRRL